VQQTISKFRFFQVCEKNIGMKILFRKNRRHSTLVWGRPSPPPRRSTARPRRCPSCLSHEEGSCGLACTFRTLYALYVLVVHTPSAIDRRPQARRQVEVGTCISNLPRLPLAASSHTYGYTR